MAHVACDVGSVVGTAALGLVALLLFYWYSTRNHGYWKKKGVKYIKPLPLFGSILDNFLHPIHENELNRYNKYGRIYGYFEGNTPALSVGDPELVRSILLKDFFSFTGRRRMPLKNKFMELNMSNLESEVWKRVRSVVSPTFSTGKLKRVFGIFKDCSQILVENFKKEAKNGESIEVKRLFGTYSMDVIASAAFSVKIDSHNDPQNKFVKNAQAFFSPSGMNWRIVLFFLSPRLAEILRVSIFDHDSMEFFREITLEVIEQRKKSGQVGNDFLQLMLDATKDSFDKEEGDEKEHDIASNYTDDGSSHQVFKTVKNKYLLVDEMIAQCMLFFMAGYETAAATLGFITYYLALHPNVQDKLRQEVDEALAKNNNELTYEVLQSMKYVDNVISETLRASSPAVRLERVADADFVLGDTGITIPKGMLVSIPSIGMHNDPEFFPAPEKFDPDRFNPDQSGNRPPYAYLPFGAGPRNCVAMRFALLEVKVCLVNLIANFVVKKSPKTKIPLDYMKGQGFLQAKEIIVDVDIRSTPTVK